MAQRQTVPSVASDVGVVLVSYNTRALLLKAVRSLQDGVNAGSRNVAVVIVDNASSDGSAEAVEREFPHVHVVRSSINRGFAAGVNLGVRQLPAGLNILLLNPDAHLEVGALAAMRQTLREHPAAAAIGPALRYVNGEPQASAFGFPGLAQVMLDLFPIPRLGNSRLNGRLWATSGPLSIGHPLGACMLIRTAAWQDVGELDESYFMYMEEVDWCRRARARGWEIWHEPRAIVTHVGAAATRQSSNDMFVHLWRSRLRYYRKFESDDYNRLIRALVRLGMRAAARRTRKAMSSPAERQARLAALAAVHKLASSLPVTIPRA